MKKRNRNSQLSTPTGSPSRPKIKSGKTKKKIRPSEIVRWKRDNNLLPYLETMLEDFHNTMPQYSIADYTKDLDTLRSRYKSEGASFATTTLPNLAKGLLEYLEAGCATYSGFKLQSGTDYPRFLRGLFKIALGNDCEDKATAIAYIYNFSVAFKKIRGPYSKSVLTKQLVDFILVDQSLPRNFNGSDMAIEPILEGAQAIVTDLFKRLDIWGSLELLPKPGPGATNTATKIHERFRPNVVYRSLEHTFPSQEFFYSHPWDACMESKKFLQLHKSARGYPTSRFKFVDKQVGKARGICIEENEMQWLQQAVKRVLYSWVERHPLTKGKINFTDQSVNADLALSASRTGEFGTIDMSEASDRIPRKLVRRLFSGVPELQRVLDVLSTRVITMPKDIPMAPLRANKYAPMGSGLCFPVMSIVHFALVRSIIQLSMQNNMDNRDNVYVYGDDIILPSTCVQAVYDWLPRFGMKLNTEKSYFRGRFRESCGVHAYNGKNITPVYFKYIPHLNAKTPALLSAIANEAMFRQRNMHATAALIRRGVTAKFGLIPYVLAESSMLGWLVHQYSDTSPKVNVGPRRWCEELQCYEYRVRVVTPVQAKNPPLIENEAYLRKLVTNAENSRHSRDFCEDLRVYHRWVPESQVLCRTA